MMGGPLIRARFFVAALTSLIFPVVAQVGVPFDPGCSLPPVLGRLAVKHQIDRTCGVAGDAPEPPHILQNKLKNNFCAQGSPVDLVRQRFLDLQTAAKATGIQFGDRNNLPPDRSQIRALKMPDGTTLGEGVLVRYVALISEARHSNVGSGESVNCTRRGPVNNDIHMDLSRTLSEEPCLSITAEISPHFRPNSWHRLAGTGSVRKREAPLGSNPVRITGPLFFDASHFPCSGNHEENPARASLWEIHPVYSIDVCNVADLAACEHAIDDELMWTPLDEFEP